MQEFREVRTKDDRRRRKSPRISCSSLDIADPDRSHGPGKGEDGANGHGHAQTVTDPAFNLVPGRRKGEVSVQDQACRENSGDQNGRYGENGLGNRSHPNKLEVLT